MSSCDIQENQCKFPSPMNLWCPDFFMILHFKFTDFKKNNMYVPFQNEILVYEIVQISPFFPFFPIILL